MFVEASAEIIAQIGKLNLLAANGIGPGLVVA